MPANGTQTNSDIQPGTSIRFPALCSSQGLIYVIDSLDVVSQCTKAGFKSGFYKTMVVIDSDLHKFEVELARKQHMLFKFGLFDILGLLEGNPRWQVELTFKPNPKTISFDQFKQLILRSFKEHHHSWDEMMDLEEFQQKIEAARSPEQVFAVCKEFNQA